MRKKTFSYILDCLFWFIVYCLPLICFILSFIKGTAVDLSTFINSLGLNILTDNIIYTSLNSIFGVGGVFPMFATTDIIIFFSYFVCCNLIKLFIDFILFIPRMFEKWSKTFYRD